MTALELLDVSKTFAGQRALSRVALTVSAGEIHALLGQNGSGKSTLIKVLSGYHEPDPGARILFDGRTADLDDRSHRSGWRGHVRFVHQDLALVETLDPVENLALERGFATGKLGRIAWQVERRRAREVFKRFGLDIDVSSPVSRLSPAERTMVAIARALQDWDENGFGVLVLDEPTVSLSKVEADRLYSVVRGIAKRGAGVLLVTHHLDEVFAVADRVTVLRDGEVVGSEAVSDLDEERLVAMIIGRSLDRFYAAAPEPTGETRLEVDSLTSAGFGPISFAARAGEIVGFAGLSGSGRELVAGLIAGAERPESGAIRVDTDRVVLGNVRAAMLRGISLVPADRVAKGLATDLSLGENLTLAKLRNVRQGARGLWRLRPRAERAEVASWIERLDIRPPAPHRAIGTFSGGNQQKVMLARSLRLSPRVLVLDEPTQGVDVGARTKIYECLAAAVQSGMAVVMCSSDGAELANECDRVFVMRDGCIAAELSGERLTESAIAAETLSSAAAHKPVPEPGIQE